MQASKDDTVKVSTLPNGLKVLTDTNYYGTTHIGFMADAG